MNDNKKIIKSYTYEELSDDKENKAPLLDNKNLQTDFNRVKDISLDVKIVFDQMNVKIEDLYKFQECQIIRLDRDPSKPLELYVGDQFIGKCEVVSYDKVLGIRLLKNNDIKEQ